MTTHRIWHIFYVAGNPSLFSKVTTADGGPLTRSEALRDAAAIVANSPTWRVWVERGDGTRAFESPAEIAYRESAQERLHVEVTRPDIARSAQ